MKKKPLKTKAKQFSTSEEYFLWIFILLIYPPSAIASNYYLIHYLPSLSENSTNSIFKFFSPLIYGITLVLGGPVVLGRTVIVVAIIYAVILIYFKRLIVKLTKKA